MNLYMCKLCDILSKVRGGLYSDMYITEISLPGDVDTPRPLRYTYTHMRIATFSK